MEALFFISSAAAAGWLGSSRARHSLALCLRLAQDGLRQLLHPHWLEAWELVSGAGTILRCCWRRSSWCRRRWRSLVELISFADAPPAGLVQTKPRCTLQTHDVASSSQNKYTTEVPDQKQAISKGSLGTLGGTDHLKGWDRVTFLLEVAQHFGKIVVKSVLGEVWFRSDCRRNIINEVALR